MRTLLTYLPAIACGVMMLVCARMMTRSHRGMDADQKTDEIAMLQEEVTRHRAERELTEPKERVDG